MLPFVFEDGFGYERYADYALDVPMYFVYRDGRYIDAAGLSFRDFLNGELSVLPGEKPTLDDWNDHLSTAFPEVRLKTFLEMRGADGGPWNRICALPALVGRGCCTIRVRSMRRGTWSRTGRSTTGRRCAMRCRNWRSTRRCRGAAGCATSPGQVLDIAGAGLAARARTNGAGDDETGFLEPLREIVRTGKVPAQTLLDRYHGVWAAICRRCTTKRASDAPSRMRATPGLPRRALRPGERERRGTGALRSIQS